MKSKIKESKYIRYIGAFLGIMLIAPIFVLAGINSLITRSISFSMFILIIMYASWEFVRNMEISKPIKVMLPLFVVVIMLLDVDLTTINKILINPKPLSNTIVLLHKTIVNSLTFYSFLLVMIIGLVVLLDPIVRMNFNPTKTIFHLLLGIAFPALAGKAIFVITVIKPIWLIFIIPTAIISDTFAYFGGLLGHKKFPKKLAPNVSPKKTWIGFWTGTIVASIYLSLLFIFYKKIDSQLGSIATVSMIILLSLGMPIFSTLGDLLYSSFKREKNIKDYSNIIPGHGGILDRIDSWVVSTIFFLVVYQLLG